MITKIERFDADIMDLDSNGPDIVMEECRLGDYVKYSDVNQMLSEIRKMCEYGVDTTDDIAKHITDLLLKR